MTPCGRCGGDCGARAETCWWCEADMCGPCWEVLGHCGHAEADAINAASLLATPEERRALILAALPGETVWDVPTTKGEPS